MIEHDIEILSNDELRSGWGGRAEGGGRVQRERVVPHYVEL